MAEGYHSSVEWSIYPDGLEAASMPVWMQMLLA